MEPSASGQLADEIDQSIRALGAPTTESIRQIRRQFSLAIRDWRGEDVLAVALALHDRDRWVAYELLYSHPSRLSQLDATTVEQLGGGMDNWGAVDAFARYISGPAWQRGVVADEVIHRWAASEDLWWRRVCGAR
jgi:DNA alkylation repair enzyme